MNKIMIEQTLSIIKPDAVERNLENNIKNFFEKNNFKIIKTLNFPDHYNYSNTDITKIKATAKNLKTKIITTEKDYNRLNKLDAEGIDFLKIELKILNENQLIDFLNKKL